MAILHKYGVWFLLAGILVLGAALRLHGLSESRARTDDECGYLTGGRTYAVAMATLPGLIKDEVIAKMHGQKHSIHEEFQKIASGRIVNLEIHSRAKAVFVPQLGAAMALFGATSAWPALAVVIIWALLGVVLVYAFAIHVLGFSRSGALWSAVFLAISPLYVAFSQYVGSFTLTGSLVVVALWLHLGTAVAGSLATREYWLATAAGAAWSLAIMSHYTLCLVVAPFVMVDLLLCLLHKRWDSSQMLRMWMMVAGGLMPLAVVEGCRLLLRVMTGWPFPAYFSEIWEQGMANLDYISAFKIPLGEVLGPFVNMEGWLFVALLICGAVILVRQVGGSRRGQMFVAFPVIYFLSAIIPSMKDIKIIVPVIPLFCLFAGAAANAIAVALARHIDRIWESWRGSVPKAGVYVNGGVFAVVLIVSGVLVQEPFIPGREYDAAVAYIVSRDPQAKIGATRVESHCLRWAALSNEVVNLCLPDEIRDFDGFMVSSLTPAVVKNFKALDLAGGCIYPDVDAMREYEATHLPCAVFPSTYHGKNPLGVTLPREVRIYDNTRSARHCGAHAVSTTHGYVLF
jgi:hypothetical protein